MSNENSSGDNELQCVYVLLMNTLPSYGDSLYNFKIHVVDL